MKHVEFERAPWAPPTTRVVVNLALEASRLTAGRRVQCVLYLGLRPNTYDKVLAVRVDGARTQTRQFYGVMVTRGGAVGPRSSIEALPRIQG